MVTAMAFGVPGKGVSLCNRELSRAGVRRELVSDYWKLGRLVGVEPTTSAATERRSATEL